MTTLDAEQRRNAAIIAEVGRKMGASKRDIQIAQTTALTESSLRNVNYGDSSGPDSRGLFQQRNGWGSQSQRMDPAGSSKLFYQALFKVKNRNRIEPWQAAQAVQRSAFSDGSNYQKNWALGSSLSGAHGATLSSASVVSSGGGGVPKLSASELAENYGFAMAFLKSHKDVYAKFQAAVAGSWTPDKFVAELKNTGWWKTTANSVRQYQILKTSDPATLGQRRQALMAQIHDSAMQMGSVMSTKQMSRIAENALMFSWNDAQVRDVLGSYTKTVNGVFNGQTGTDIDAVKQTAWRNGVNVSSATLQNWAQQMAKGNMTASYYQDYVRKQAKALAPGYTHELDSGMDLIDIAQPYIQSKAKLLEKNPADMDLFDPDIRGALSAKDSNGKPTSTSLWEFEQQMRKKPEWLKTQQAQDSTMATGHQVLKDMGFAW